MEKDDRDIGGCSVLANISIVDIISLGRREKSLAGYKGTLSSVGRGDHQISNEGCLTC